MAASTILISEAKTQASSAGLDPTLVCAIIEQESSWVPWVIRFEPAFLTKYILPQNLSDVTEQYARGFSWGLMQIMGEVAREHGYSGHLAALCDPPIGIQWGIAHWKTKLTAAAGNISKALLLWNGGANPQYASEVLARVKNYK